MWISDGVRGAEGSPHADKKFLNVNIISFEKVDKPKGGGRKKWTRFFC